MIASIFLALVPIVALAVFVSRMESISGGQAGLVILAFGIGMGVTVPLVFAGALLVNVQDAVDPLTMLVVQSFVFAGLLEEGGKLGVAYLAFGNRPDVSRDSYMRLILAISLGFALMENLMHISGGASTMLARLFSAVPLHVAATGIGAIPYATSLGRSTSPSYPGFLLAVLIHGSYNALVGLAPRSGSMIPWILAVALMLLAFGAYVFLWTRASAQDVEGQAKRP